MKKIKNGMICIMLLLFSALCLPTTNLTAQEQDMPQVDIIESDDTFATDEEWNVEVVSEDWIIVIINCPGVWGFCTP